MSSTTPAPTLTSILSTLAPTEAAQVVAAITPGLEAGAAGDGTATSALGAWLQIQAALVSNASLFQKIGVNTLFAATLAEVNALNAKIQAAPPVSAPETAAS